MGRVNVLGAWVPGVVRARAQGPLASGLQFADMNLAVVLLTVYHYGGAILDPGPVLGSLDLGPRGGGSSGSSGHYIVNILRFSCF